MEEDRCCFNRSQLNYFRVCHLATNVLPNVLRNIFIEQWDVKYGKQCGNWRNEKKNGEDFVRMESLANKKRNKDLLNSMVDGDIEKWDCTKLFYAILFSTSIGANLQPILFQHVNELRVFRNESFAHVDQGEVSSSDFQKTVNKVLQALLGLGQKTLEVKRIQNQMSFTKDEIYELEEMFEQERKSKEELNMRIGVLENRVEILETKAEEEGNSGDVYICPRTAGDYLLENGSTDEKITSPFVVLPARPVHQIINRHHVEAARNSIVELNIQESHKVTALYIVGGPGSGKTECARQIGKSISEQRSLVMTLPARNMLDYSLALKELALHLGISDEAFDCLQRASIESQIEILSLFVREKLAHLPAWLLILDGLAKDTLQVLEYLPQIGDQSAGQIIVTTQDKSMVPDSPYTTCISLSNGLSFEESFQLLSAISGPPDPSTAKIVSEMLGGQPMFLVSAANRIKKLSTKSRKPAEVTWKEQLESLKTRHKEEELPYYLAALDQPMRTKVESVIKMLMRRSPVYEECFHLLVLAQGAGLSLKFLVKFLSSQLNLEDKEVELLLRESLILRTIVRSYHAFVEVNGVVYKLLADLLTPSVRTERMVQRLRYICHFAVKMMHDPTLQKVFKRFTPKILQYLSLLDRRFPDCAEQRSLHHELGEAFLCVLVDYSAAVQCFTKAMSIFENANEVAHLEYARILSSLGNVFRLTGSMDEACKYLNKSLQLLKALYNGLLNEDVAGCLSILGLIYQSKGDLDRARELHHRALTIREQIHGENHIKTATSLNNIGGVYHERGDLGTAKDYYWRALEIKGRNYGWDFPHVANSFNNIAEISHEQGDLDGAILVHKRALKIRQRLYGEEHPDIANSLNNIGVIYHKQRELHTSRKHHARALEIRKKVYGEEHTEVASSLNNLGEVYYDEGDLANAEKFHTQALGIRQRYAVTSSNPDVITSLVNLIRVYVADQEISTATAYAYEVFKVSQQIYGMKDRRTVSAFERLTELSKRKSEGHSIDIPFNTYEHVERLSCL